MQFTQEVPEGVEVETFTVIAYSDGRPTEVMIAGTEDDTIQHVSLSAVGDQLIADAMLGTMLTGIKEVLYHGPAADR